MKNALFFSIALLFVAASASAVDDPFAGTSLNNDNVFAPPGANMPAETQGNLQNAGQGRMQEMTLQQMQERVHERTRKLDTMTPDQWQALRAKMQQRAERNGRQLPNLTLAQVQDRAHKMEQKIDALTPEQWEAFKANRTGASPAGQPQPAAHFHAPFQPVMPSNAN